MYSRTARPFCSRFEPFPCRGGPVFLVHQRAREKKVGGGAVAGDRDVADDGKSKERFDVDVVWLGLKRIPEEDDEVDPSFGDCGADLLVAAEGAAEE